MTAAHSHPADPADCAPDAPAAGVADFAWHAAALAAAPVRMTPADLDEVAAIELDAYPFPWSRGNFADSLSSGYTGMCVRDLHGRLLAYSMLMPVIDEVHLLNLCVARAQQRQGLGAALLAACVDSARVSGFGSMLLEVRPSNLPAIALYERFGFSVIGRRKNYYPAPGGLKEDALVMRLEDLTRINPETLHVVA